jgi:hypothetical protein
MKKKTIKINFRYFWEGFNPEDNFFTNLLRKKYHIKISENPDYMFYSVYPESRKIKDLSKKGEFIKKISPRLYILLRKIYSQITNLSSKKIISSPEGNFVKIFYASEHIKPDMTKCDWAFSSYFEEEINHPRYMRIPMYRISDYKLKTLGKPPINKKINISSIKKEKTQFCNFIYSQEISSRNDFFKKLNKYKKIDSPGRCMNNMSAIGSHNSPKNSRNSNNWVKEKLKFLRNYKFTISFENFSSSGWVTEKLTHPMLVNSIPIYIGHKDVNREFNTKSFINYHDFTDMKSFIDYIIKVDKDDKLYEKILNEPWYIKNKPNKWFDDSIYLKRFEEIFG